MIERYGITADVVTPVELKDKLNEISKRGLNVVSCSCFPLPRPPSAQHFQAIIVTENVYG